MKRSRENKTKESLPFSSTQFPATFHSFIHFCVRPKNHLQRMISNLSLPPAPPLSSAESHQMESNEGTPTPPNSTSGTSPTTTSSTPGAIQQQQPQPQMMISPTSAGQGGIQHPSNGHQRTNRTFFRPPGLGPEGPDGAESFPTNVQVCPHCGFSCSSKFHYNSHMNTHTTHQCPMCTYQSRTEGRLKKHIQQSHTHEQRVAAGICITSPPPPPTMPPSGQNQQQNSPSKIVDEQPPNNGANMIGSRGGGQIAASIPTTIAPLLNRWVGGWMRPKNNNQKIIEPQK